MKVLSVLCLSLPLLAWAYTPDDHDLVGVNGTIVGGPGPVVLPLSPTISSTSLPLKTALNPKKRHIGVIIGGVVGGMALVILLCLLLLLVVMRRRRRQLGRIEPPLPDTRGPLGGFFSQIEGIDWATMPPATSPAVHASTVAQLVTPLITPSLEKPTSPIVTSIASDSISKPLPSELQPTEAVPIQNHDYEDSTSANTTTPRESTIGSGTASASSSVPLVPRSTRYLTDDEVDFVATLYRQRLPPSDVARIIENMLDEGETGNKGEGASSELGSESRPT